VRVDPAKLRTGKHQGQVQFKDESGASAALSVAVQVGNVPAIAVRGDGCELREGKLHVRSGAGCTLSAADGEAAGVQWRLPGGSQVAGARLYGQFVRPGEFQVLVSSDEGEVDAIPVLIE
jgi:hypothetical protein